MKTREALDALRTILWIIAITTVGGAVGMAALSLLIALAKWLGIAQ